MTLTNESTASQSEDPPEAGKELKLCVDQQETQIIVKSLLQVRTGQSDVPFLDKITGEISSYKSSLTSESVFKYKTNISITRNWKENIHKQT